MITPNMRTVGRGRHFLIDEKNASISSNQVAPGKKLSQRQQLPSCGVAVHLDHDGDVHYTCATQGLVLRTEK